jgi:CubicO group peptidase (beta-lactamase class C family)
VLEKAADAPWAQFVQQNVFAPLGMAHSGAAPPGGAARLYTRDAAERFQVVPPAATDHPAGSAAWSSAGDAARFLQAILNEGTLDGATLLKPESVRELFATEKSTPHAGLGWFVGDYLGQASFSHAGSLPGAMAELRGFPKDKSGVVVLSNADGHMLTGQIIWAVAGALYPEGKGSRKRPR